MKNILRVFAGSLLLLAIGSAIAHSRNGHDSSAVPVIVAPDPSIIASGQAATVTVTMNETVTSDTVVSLGSSYSGLTVPATVTVLNGHSTANFQAQASSPRPNSAHSHEFSRRNTYATITATANLQSAQATVEITSR